MPVVLAPTASTQPPAAAAIDPNRTLWLLSLAHAVNHAQAVLLPLVYIRIIGEFGVTAATVALLAAAGAFASGAVQLSYAKLTRMISRRKILGAGGILFGGGFAAQAIAPTFPSFAVVNVVVARRRARRSTRSATGCSPSSSRRSDAASRSAPTSPAATSGRSSWRSSARR